MDILWPSHNKTVFSNVFTVPPMKVAVLFATGLLPERVRVSSEEVVTTQSMCVRKVIYGFDASNRNIFLPCNYVFDIDSMQADKLIDQLVKTCNLPWQLDTCRNIGIIGVPGTYRLELNDSTAVGVAQAWIELVSIESFPNQVKDLFFT